MILRELTVCGYWASKQSNFQILLLTRWTVVIVNHHQNIEVNQPK